MLKDFHLIHRRKPHMFEPGVQPIWETCLRSIAFSADASAAPDDEVYSQQHAYRFLLEVICGLHSPVVGETEVFGQFKNFTKLWLERQPQHATLVQRIFSEVKEIRSQYLRNLGTQSYGSWLKRKVTANQVHILGSGSLAQEIVPHLLKAAEAVTVHSRSPEKVRMSGVQVRALREQAFNGGCLIVAAPLTATYIAQWMKVKPEQLFDLRDVSSSDPIGFAGRKRHVLNDVFGEIERTKALLQPLVETVKSDILARSERVATQVHVRPQGWDDICA
jgi:glutamyl-tRNA reductase